MGEKDTDDLQDETSYEEYLAEEGGFGSSYYNDDGYNYDESSELTDVDYNPNDDSAQFTGGGVGSDAYDPVSRDDDEEQVSDASIEAGVPGYGAAAVTENYIDDYDDDDDDNFDSGDDEEDSEDDEDEETEDNLVVGADGEPVVQTGDEKDYDGVVKWKPGDKITLELLNQVWGECRHIDKVRPMMNSANEAVTEALNALGPNLMLKLDKYINKTSNAEMDTIGSLLALATKDSKRLTFTALSVVEAIFDQQWLQTVTLATLPKALEAAIMVEPVKSSLEKIFTVAVPLINKKHRKK